MAVPAFQDYPLADRDREWDSAAAEKRIREWAGAKDEPNAQYRLFEVNRGDASG